MCKFIQSVIFRGEHSNSGESAHLGRFPPVLCLHIDSFCFSLINRFLPFGEGGTHSYPSGVTVHQPGANRIQPCVTTVRSAKYATPSSTTSWLRQISSRLNFVTKSFATSSFLGARSKQMVVLFSNNSTVEDGVLPPGTRGLP